VALGAGLLGPRWVDHKTGGCTPKANTHAFYQNQMDLYTLLLEGNGHKTKRVAYLIYYHPVEGKAHSLIRFQVDVQEVPTDPATAEALVKDAVAILHGPAPVSSSSCGFYRWNSAVLAWEATPRLNQ